MAKFAADPMILGQQGRAINDQAAEFKNNSETVFRTVEAIISSDYVSPASQEIGRQILSKKDDIAAMRRIMEDYGNFCGVAGSTVTRNEENNIDTFKFNN